MAADDKLTGVMSKLTVDDSEQVYTIGTDMKSANQGGTEHTTTEAEGTVQSDNAKSIAGKPVDDNGNPEENEAGELEVVDTHKTDEPALSDSAKTSELSPPSDSVETSELSLPSDPAKTSDLSPSDPAKTSDLPVTDPAKTSDPPVTDPAKTSDPPGAVSDLPVTYKSFLKDYITKARGYGNIKIRNLDYTKQPEDCVIPLYMRCHTCNDIKPEILGVSMITEFIRLNEAVEAFFRHDVKAIPIWDEPKGRPVAMFTITDFLKGLAQYCHVSNEEIKIVENQHLGTWMKTAGLEDNRFIKLKETESLYDATRLLVIPRIHRLAITFSNDSHISYVLTKRRLLHFLVINLFNLFEYSDLKTPVFLLKSLEVSKVGTFINIAVIHIRARVIDALKIFLARNVSSLPVVNNSNVFINIFDKYDILQLLRGQKYQNLNMTIEEAIRTVSNHEYPLIVTLDCNLLNLIANLVYNSVHRAVVINQHREVIGIVSLSDILKFLVLDPLEMIEEVSSGASSIHGSQKRQRGLESDEVMSFEIEDII